MIDICDLTKKFGDKAAVECLSLHISKGEFFGLLVRTGREKQPWCVCSVRLQSPRPER